MYIKEERHGTQSTIMGESTVGSEELGLEDVG